MSLAPDLHYSWPYYNRGGVCLGCHHVLRLGVCLEVGPASVCEREMKREIGGREERSSVKNKREIQRWGEN